MINKKVFGDKQHAYMLKCALLWIEATYPELWLVMKYMPAEYAIDSMLKALEDQ